jgi:hypothetical protein
MNDKTMSFLMPARASFNRDASPDYGTVENSSVARTNAARRIADC